MKILIANSLYSPNFIGGAEKSVQHLAEYLVKLGHEVTVITTGRKDEEKRIQGVRVLYLGNRNIYWFYDVKSRSFILKAIFQLIDTFNLFNYFQLQRLIKKVNPDVIHTHNLKGISVIVWKVASKLRIPVVHTIRDFYLLCIKSTMFKNEKVCAERCIECKLFTIPKKRLSESVSFVTGISSFVLKQHHSKDYFKNNKHSVIYNSFHLPEEYKVRNGSSEVTFGCVGQVVRTKGIQLLIDTFSELPDCKLVVYGKIIEPDLKIAMEKVENISYLGFKGPNEIYSNIDMLIVPSLWNEPFGRVIVEAFSHAIPVIGSDRGGIPELIENGKNGFVIDPTNKEKLKQLIMSLKNNPSRIKTLSENARNSADNFREEILVNDYVEVYKELIKGT